MIDSKMQLPPTKFLIAGAIIAFIIIAIIVIIILVHKHHEKKEKKEKLANHIEKHKDQVKKVHQDTKLLFEIGQKMLPNPPVKPTEKLFDTVILMVGGLMIQNELIGETSKQLLNDDKQLTEKGHDATVALDYLFNEGSKYSPHITDRSFKDTMSLLSVKCMLDVYKQTGQFDSLNKNQQTIINDLSPKLAGGVKRYNEHVGYQSVDPQCFQ